MTESEPSRNTTESLSGYERARLTEAREWARAEPSMPGKVLRKVTSGSRKLVERAMESPKVSSALERTAERLLAEFDPVMPDTGVAAEPHAMDADRRADFLDEADAHAGEVRKRYVGLLGVQGAVTGAASINPLAAVAAIATDVTAMTLGLLRATADILTGYQHVGDLRTTSIATLLLAGEPDATKRREGLLVAAGIRPRSANEAEELPGILAEQAGPRLVNEAVESIVRRRAQQRALGAVPFLGAAAGAATSAWMTNQACTAARHVGRLGFLHTHVRLDPALLKG